MILNNLLVFGQMLLDVVDPWTLLLSHLGCELRVFYLPFVYEIIFFSNFGGYRRNSKLCKGPVILVSTNGNAHHFFASTFLCSFCEWSFFRNLSKNVQNTWSSFFDVIFISAVERVDERIAVRVHVDNKGKIILVLN